MGIIYNYLQKSISVLRLGSNWVIKLGSNIIEAGRTISYVETVNPSQADTFHNEIKNSNEYTFRKEYELQVRKIVNKLKLKRVKVAIDVTKELYWGKNGTYNTRGIAYEKSNESWQYITLAVVEPYFIPLMVLPYRQIDNLDDLAIDLLKYLEGLNLNIDLILFDRGFYHAHLIDYLEGKQRGYSLPYLMFIPRNEIVKEYIESTKSTLIVYKHTMNYNLKKSTWKPETTIVICKGVSKDKNGNIIDWCFATNQKPSINLIFKYRKRWNIETGFRIQDEARIKTKSSNPLIRYFYQLISMLMILAWRLANYKAAKVIVFKRFLKLIEESYTLKIFNLPYD